MEKQLEQLNKFLKKLEIYPNTNNIENQYKNEICLNNLKIYLTKMIVNNPKILIIGEAPGYKGCAKTGIPFTDERNMIEANHTIFGLNNGYTLHNEKCLYKERTSKIVFEAIKGKENKVLMWNIFPFHPYNVGTIEGNRTPNINEIEEGFEFTINLLDIFKNIKKENIYAIGRKAQNELEKNNIIFSQKYIRHPSNGGANEFRKNIINILSN